MPQATKRKEEECFYQNVQCEVVKSQDLLKTKSKQISK